MDEYIILDADGTYFFWPAWSTNPGFLRTTLDSNHTTTETILDFTWPQGNFGTDDDFCFWAAFLLPETTSLYGDVDQVKFGYR